MDFNRNLLLMMDDAALSRVCRISFSKGSGPGGQKRNKTSSLATVELPGLGLSASDCTERSQFRNRSNALKKLRKLIALNYRDPIMVIPENLSCSMNSPAYPLFAAQLLDIMKIKNWDYRATAEFCGISPSAMLKKLYRDPELWQFLQARRLELELPKLMPPGH